MRLWQLIYCPDSKHAPTYYAGRAWLALKAKERWVQDLLDRRARVSGLRDTVANRQVDQLLLLLSSALAWLIVLVRPWVLPHSSHQPSVRRPRSKQH